MKNKLGITNDYDIRLMEYELFNFKYHLIDEKFTFNETNFFSVEFLEKIHIFLFCDMYDEETIKIREAVSADTLKNISALLNELYYASLNYDAKKFSEIIYKIWEQQIFYDGNTRTLLCYIKIISRAFGLNINYDFEKNIYKDYFINEIIDCIYSEDIKDEKIV